jgi:hypothetical protein
MAMEAPNSMNLTLPASPKWRKSPLQKGCARTFFTHSDWLLYVSAMMHPTGRSKNIHWRPVDLAGLFSDVGEDAEAGKPACEQPGDPISEGNVDRQPSFTEPHHAYARGDDRDDYDGSEAHGVASPSVL